MGGYFDLMSGHNDSRFTDHFLVFDFDRLRAQAAAVAGDEAMFRAPDDYTSDLRSEEKSKSAYLQYTKTFETKMPFHVAAGVRYEETEVYSESLVRIGQTISWDSANEFNIGFATEQGFDSGTGKYDYVLPSLDLKLDVKDNLVVRASYSETIGRPGWNDIQGGANLAGQLRFDGGTGSSGDPSLKPLESTNYDLSLEWYYGEGSYASVGYFRKEISNFISNVETVETPFEMHTPAGGAFWNEATPLVCDRRLCQRKAVHPRLHLRESPNGSGRHRRSRHPEREASLASRAIRLRRSGCRGRRTCGRTNWMDGNSTSSTCSATAALAFRLTTRWSIRA